MNLNLIVSGEVDSRVESKRNDSGEGRGFSLKLPLKFSGVDDVRSLKWSVP